MLKRLHLQNFTVFADADFEFGPGLNVLVGTNGTGKSHVLKLGYVVEAVGFSLSKDFSVNDLISSFVGTSAWNIGLFKLLPKVFQSGRLATLVRWSAKERAIIVANFEGGESGILSFEMYPKQENANNEASIKVSRSASSIDKISKPVFIPAKEILTLSWILPASEQLVIPIESNYLDLFNQLRLLPLRNPESVEAIAALTDIVGGEIRAEGDTYFLVDTTGRRVEINMIAEGIRKFGTLQKLLANGSLTKSTTLYWDEPEANLNPALLRKLAAILAELARQGFQIVLATHSMSLLKEFHILSRQKEKGKLPIRYFGLNAEPGQATTVVTQDDFEYLPDIVALEVELEQADDLEEIFAREDRQFHADNRGKE